MNKPLLLFLLLLLLYTGQAKAQVIPIYEPDRLALLELARMEFLDSSFIPAAGVSVTITSLNGTNVELALPAGVPQSEWRVRAMRPVNLRAGAASLPLSTLAANAFTDSSFQFLEVLNLSGNELTGDFSAFATKTLPRLVEANFSFNAITNIDGLLSACTGRGLKIASFGYNSITNIPAVLLEDFDSLQVLDFEDCLLTALPAPQAMCSISVAAAGLNFACPCYGGLEKLRAIKLWSNQLSGTFYPEHFLGKQWEAKANNPLDLLTMEMVEISENNFNDVSTLLINAVFADPNANDAAMVDFLSQPRMIDTTIGTDCWELGHLHVEDNLFDPSDLHAFNVALGATPAVLTSLGIPVGTCTGNPITRYLYAPQRLDSIGTGGLRRRGAGHSLNFDLDIEDWAFRYRDRQAMVAAWGISRHDYTWKWGRDSVNVNLPTFPIEPAFSIVTADIVQPTTGSATFDTLNANGIFLQSTLNMSGEQRVGIRTTAHRVLDCSHLSHWVHSPDFPFLDTLFSRRKDIIIGDCYDADSNVIMCQEMTIQLNNSARNEERDAAIRYLQDTLGARKTRDCMCGDVQLWVLPDNIELTANGAGTRSAIPSTRNKPGLRSADANYPLETGNSAATMAMPSINASQGSTDPNRTLIAIIDSGSDPDHPLLAQHIRANARETQNDGIDNDGNCLVDDILGFNFLDNNNIPYDDINHGTIVGSIAAGIGTPSISPSSPSVALLPIKFTNRFGQGSTFEAACGIYYAVDYHRNRSTGVRDEDSVRVINASWGYRGEFSHVLNDAIEYAGRRCGVLFVCAAGNDAQDMDNDVVGNYPAHFSLPNILVVAATDGGANLAAYSNYGRLSAHIAAPGTFTGVAIPQQGASPNTTNVAQSGTSFATPYVSRAAAILFNEYPTASAEAVKQALTSTATPLASADSSRLASGGVVNLDAARAYLGNMTAISFCTEIVGVEETTAEQARSQYILFPNPARENLQIAFTESYTEATILLFDTKGSEISRLQARGETHISLSLANLPQGLYLVQVRTGGQTETHKIVKMD